MLDSSTSLFSATNISRPASVLQMFVNYVGKNGIQVMYASNITEGSIHTSIGDVVLLKQAFFWGGSELPMYYWPLYTYQLNHSTLNFRRFQFRELASQLEHWLRH
jgi:hypothetical protein